MFKTSKHRVKCNLNCFDHLLTPLRTVQYHHSAFVFYRLIALYKLSSRPSTGCSSSAFIADVIIKPLLIHDHDYTEFVSPIGI